MNKKTNIIINILIAVAIVGGALTFWYMQRFVPYWQCSEVYKRYSKVEGVRATYVKDYRVNDTLTVATTLLEATDSTGWEYLIRAFNIMPEMIELAKEDTAFDIWTRHSLSNHPETPYNNVDTNISEGKDIEMVIMSILRQKIIVFHTKNENESDAVLDKGLKSNL